MNKQKQSIQDAELEEIKVTGYGYELIRETLLPDILGKETQSILYWAGKSLARKLPLPTMEDIASFFLKASWGELTISNETDDTIVLTLTGELIQNRLNRKDLCSFQLEAGFLASQIQQQKGITTEASEEQKKKQGMVIFTVKSDTFDEAQG